MALNADPHMLKCFHGMLDVSLSSMMNLSLSAVEHVTVTCLP